MRYNEEKYLQNGIKNNQIQWDNRINRHHNPNLLEDAETSSNIILITWYQLKIYNTGMLYNQCPQHKVLLTYYTHRVNP